MDKWIPVEERLPELKLHHGGIGVGDFYCSDSVLICCAEPVFDLGRIFIGFYEKEYGWSDYDGSVQHGVIKPTAWMELPAPYDAKSVPQSEDDKFKEAWLEVDKLLGERRPDLPKNTLESPSATLERIRRIFWEVGMRLQNDDRYEP